MRLIFSFFISLILAIPALAAGKKILSVAAKVVVVAVPDPLGQVTSFQLISTQTGFLPFSLGMGFKKGDVPAGCTLDIPDSQVVIMRKWNDGSAKHAIISGHVNLVANVSKAIGIYRGVSASSPALTASHIAAANPSATVSLGALGSVSLSSLLSAPTRTFVSGPEMVEAHYRGSASGVLIFFHVRLFKNGRLWIRTSVESGFSDVAGSDKSYSANVSIGGTTVYSGSLTHYNHMIGPRIFQLWNITLRQTKLLVGLVVRLFIGLISQPRNAQLKVFPEAHRPTLKMESMAAFAIFRVLKVLSSPMIQIKMFFI